MPIILGATGVPLSLALLVGWTLLIASRLAEADGGATEVWLLVLGAVSFVVVMAELVLFSIFLAREILEVRRQDSFIDSVTHELKSPLASIKLCLETLARAELGEGQREELRLMMLEDVDRLSSFIDDVLSASRIAHAYQTTQMSLSDVRLLELVESCVDSALHRHKLPDGAIEVDVPADLTLTTDEAAIALVIKNLLDNAVKYSNEPARIRVLAARSEERAVRIEVIDEGIGIPPKQLKRVFNRFYRVESEIVRHRKGTGLGLFVVSALVRNLGGKVEAHSEGEGEGTTMRVILPSAERVSVAA